MMLHFCVASIIDNLPSCFLNLRLGTFFVCISESQDA